jgi:hypothetical protein
MGHDIDILEGGPKGYTLTETNISFNWSKFSEYFHIRDIQGHPGRLVAKHLHEVLYKLAKDGYEPNANMRVDGWGQAIDKSAVNAWDDPDYKKDLMCMFAYHIKSFLTLAERHPNGYWYSDQVSGGSPLYDVEPKLGSDDSDNESDDSPSDTADNLPVTAFRHPIRGIMMIRTYSDAMEVYRVMTEKNDPRAKWWHDLAFTLPS